MFYSKTTGGFYDEAIHGHRVVSIIDPAWVCPEVDGVPDGDAVPPCITFSNADCKIPADAVEITDAEHAALLDGQSQGKRIVAGPDGHPELADPPPVDPQIAIDAKLVRLRSVREEILNRLGGIAGRADRKGDKTTADACDVATQGLLDITKDLPAELAEIELMVLTRYKGIVTTAAAAAPGLVSAFAGMDL